MRNVLLLALLAPVGAAVAADGPVTGPAVVSMLEGLGYSAELDRDGAGDPLVLTRAGGLDYAIYFYDCSDDACEALQFRIGLDLENGTTHEVINEFNRGYRYVRSFLDEEADPFLLMDVEMTHADHSAQFNTHLGIWEDLLDAFTLAVGFRQEGEDLAGDRDRVAWPVAPQLGSFLAYDSTYTSVTHDGSDQSAEISATGLARIAVEEDGEGGFLQRWSSSDTQVELNGLPPEAAAAFEGAITAMDGIVLEARLDQDGHFVSLANLDQVALAYRQVVQVMFDDINASLPVEGGAGSGEVDVSGMLDLLASPQVLERQLAELPVAYNFPSGGGLVPGREYAYQDEGTSPLGGDVIPMNNSMLLRSSSEVPGHYEMEWTLLPDPDAMWGAIDGAARQLLGNMAADDTEAGEQLEQAMAELGEDAAFTTTVRYRIDAATGIVHRMEHVSTKRFGGREEVETNLLVLREPAD